MHILEMVCAILKQREGLASRPVLENDSFSLRNEQSAPPVLTNGKRRKIEYRLLCKKMLPENIMSET